MHSRGSLIHQKTVKMETILPLVGFVCVFVFFIPSTSGRASYASPVNLDQNCNRNVTIPCPTQGNGAGTVQFLSLPLRDCMVNVTLEASCGLSQNEYALYFNIRKFDLPVEDRIRIYESTSGERELVKSLSFYHQAFSYPASVAQVLTQYSRQPAISIEYSRGSGLTSSSNGAILDYVVLAETSASETTYCIALKGYVSNNYVCDKDGANQRCNCPDDYWPKTGTNPASSRQYCSVYTGETTINHGDDGVGLLIGLCMGIPLVVIVSAVGIRIFLARRRRGNPRPVNVSTVTGGISVSRPMVVGNYDRMRDEMGAPPAYSEGYKPAETTSVAVSTVSVH